tara:strand:- start:1738 stop:3378 length:1641 start_codon:yes stop_codon:yes gene_type:complete
MNTIFNNLLEVLSKEFKNFGLNEDVQLNLSKVPEFDLQINNLVKYNKSKFFNELQNNLIEKINNSNYFLPVLGNEIGFLNLSLNHSLLINYITNSTTDFENKKPEKIIFDYGGPNIGKPLHVGHMRTLNIGRSLYNIYSFIGNEVVSDVHLGDWGMPIAQIITYCEKMNIDIMALNVEQLETIYPKASKDYKGDGDFKIRAQEINKLLNKNDKELIKKWKALKNISIKSLEENFKILNHRFDYWLGESDVNDLIPNMIENLIEDKKVIDDFGALVSTQNTEPKILITKSDGSYLYITTDLATILFRQEKIGYDKAFYIVDNRQSLHFKQLFDSITYFKFNNLHHEHVSYGTMNDVDGNPFKTRDGGTKPLNELYEETYKYIEKINSSLSKPTIKNLTNSVLTYSDLITNRKTDYKFDIQKFTNVNGKTGIYIQYSQVRAKKLLDNMEFHENKFEELILNESDKNLLSKLMLFGYYLEQSASQKEPHHLANYIYEISNLFNQFYEGEKISDLIDESHVYSKLFLTKLFLTTSHNVMFCLGIVPVSEM